MRLQMLLVGLVCLLFAAPLWPQEDSPAARPNRKRPAAAAGQPELRPARDRWVEKADRWHKDPLSLNAPACAVAKNLYYVGNKRFSSHLLVGEKEIVLFDTPYPTHFDMLTNSIRSVGVDPRKRPSSTRS
jgi:hypothetical protein